MSDTITLRWERSLFNPAIDGGDDFSSYCNGLISKDQLATRKLKQKFEAANIPVNETTIVGFTARLLIFRWTDNVKGRYVSHSNSHLCLFAEDRIVSVKWNDIKFVVA